MIDEEILRKYLRNPAELANYFLKDYYSEHEMIFPINPF